VTSPSYNLHFGYNMTMVEIRYLISTMNITVK
jgi:hypothetical protein